MLALVPAAASAGALAPASPASPAADDERAAYVVVVVIAVLLAIGLIAGLIAATRGSGGDEPERRTRGTSGVQARVGAGLGVLAVAIFVFGVIVTESAREVEPTGADGLQTVQRDLSLPADAEPLEIEVSGQQWLWRYQYPDGTFSYYEMVVPVDTAVVLKLDSTDVLHSWWIPALGGQAAVAPGSDNQTWFKATETGEFEGSSTEFSGPGYATMRARVRVVEPAEYQAWLTQQAEDIKEAQEAVAERVLAEDTPDEQLEEDAE